MPPILTFAALKEFTPVYDDFITVHESDLPTYYRSVFPSKCSCGGEVIMTSGAGGGSKYTQLQCCNPDCWVKMAHRFSYFCKSLGYKGFGEATSLNLYRDLHKTFQQPTFLSIFKVPESEIFSLNGEAYAASFFELRNDLYFKSFQFKDAIASLGIPHVGKNSTLFDVVKSPVTLLEYILQKRLIEVYRAANIHAPKTRYYFDIAQLDILTLVLDIMPNILSTPNREVYIAITGGVTVDGVSLTRQAFIQKCESIKDQNGVQAFKIIETKAASKLDYVIADAPSNSSKYQLGVRLGKLTTAQCFYDLLKSSIGGVNSE